MGVALPVSYTFVVVVTNTKVNNQLHNVQVNLICTDEALGFCNVLESAEGFTQNDYAATVRTDVFTP
jgi:hypothetical protein